MVTPAHKMSVLLVLLAATIACEPNKPAPDKPATPTDSEPAAAARATEPDKVTPDKAAPEEDAPEPEEPAEPVVIDTEKAKASVLAWVKTQNEGDFDAYQGMYADKFQGIKRVGPKTFKYDRSGWVKDRGRMFKKKMEVQARYFEFKSSSSSVVVRFEQTWASGSYKDVGAKQLVLVPARDGDALVIAREEMLDSKVEGQQEIAPLATGSIGFFQPWKNPLLVLPKKAKPVKRAKLTTVKRGRSALVEPAKIPEDLSALVGQSVSFSNFEGQLCSAKVTGVKIYAEAIPHFGLEQTWNDPEDRQSDRVVNAEIVSLADTDLRWALVTDGDKEQCDGARFGRVGDEIKPMKLTAEVDKATRATALEKFRELRGYKILQKEFKSSGEGKGRWDQYGIKPRYWTVGEGAETSYVVIASDTGEGCGGFDASFWAIWEVKGSNWSLLTDAKQPGWLGSEMHFGEILGAFDADGDGKPEFISPTQIIRANGPVWKITEDIAPPYFDCPC